MEGAEQVNFDLRVPGLVDMLFFKIGIFVLKKPCVSTYTPRWEFLGNHRSD